MQKLNLKNKKSIFVLASILVVLIIIAGVVIFKKSYNNNTVETAGEIIEKESNSDTPNNEINEVIPVNGPVDENQVVNQTGNSNTTQTPNTSISSKSTYYVKVNNSQNVVTIYTKDASGNYTVPVKAMVCSTGTSTPQSGKYKMPGVKHRWHTLFGHTPGTYVYGQYTTTIVGNILFHSVPYTKNGDPSSLEYWEYDKLGTSASAGCIRLTVQDAKWIYNNISAGTIVEFYSDSNPGPLGKPSAQKISNNEQCRNWDPTDADSRNPWRKNNNSTQVQQPQQPQQPQQTPSQEQKPIENEQQKPNENKNNEVQNNTTNNNIDNSSERNNIILDSKNENKVTVNDTVIINNTVSVNTI